MAEQQHVGERDEGGALPARRHVPRAEVAHDPDAHAFGDHRRVAQLERGATRLVPHRLAMRRDERHLAGRHLRRREQLQHGPREALAQRDV